MIQLYRCHTHQNTLYIYKRFKAKKNQIDRNFEDT